MTETPEQTWTAGIVTMWFTCQATTEEEAERKYAAFFDQEDGSCCAPQECSCDLSDTDVSHSWEAPTHQQGETP